MPVSLTAATISIGSLLLGVSLLASDAASESSDESSEAITDRLARLEEEIAMLSAEPTMPDAVPDSWACCCAKRGWITAIDWINWQVRQRERYQTLAAPRGPFFPTDIEPVEFNRANGVRASLGYQFVNGWQLAFIYSHLSPHASEVIATGLSQRDVDLDFDVYDLQLLRPFALSQDLDLSVFGSVRCATLNQEFSEEGVPTASSQSLMTADTDATGLRVGGMANWELASGLSIFGSLGGAVLVQKSTRTYSSSSSSQVDNMFDTDSCRDGLPILETAAGLAWVNGQLTIRAGYELATWFNITEVGTLPVSGRPNQTRSLTFDGVFIQLAALF